MKVFSGIFSAIFFLSSRACAFHIEVATSVPRRSEMTATVTREAPAEPTAFTILRFQDSLGDFPLGAIATTTETDLVPHTVLFSIATPGIFHLEAVDEASSVIASSNPFTVFQA
ncbi:hypothetical protein VKT23_015348 [Stygiomarasmius scandens]|uniref:Uncharacterized protein n=1 Tax=Marasmiellus scandens TaxID=2682957 RepID=A0ABR1J1G2_9AGAR